MKNSGYLLGMFITLVWGITQLTVNTDRNNGFDITLLSKPTPEAKQDKPQTDKKKNAKSTVKTLQKAVQENSTNPGSGYVVKLKRLPFEEFRKGILESMRGMKTVIFRTMGKRITPQENIPVPPKTKWHPAVRYEVDNCVPLWQDMKENAWWLAMEGYDADGILKLYRVPDTSYNYYMFKDWLEDYIKKCVKSYRARQNDL